MLVCNVSLRPPRTAIAASVAEVATALDDLGSGSGQVVFATLVDDPASVAKPSTPISARSWSRRRRADATTPAPSTLPRLMKPVLLLTSPDASLAGAAAVTTMTVKGPLFMFDVTFPSSSLTVINVGR